jgi:hypothetical protein
MGKDYLESLGLHGMIILKYILNNLVIVMWNEFKLFRIVSNS